MPVHEQKNCPRCNKAFECKVGDVVHCQCNSLQLSIEERSFIESKYHDCLCHQCLTDLKNKYIFFKEKYFLQ